VPASAQYAARRNGDDVQLEDVKNKTVVTIRPKSGNLGSEMKVNGQSVLGTQGIPVLAPWANRLDQNAFWANGKKYLLNPGLETVHYDNNHLPIHGLLDKAVWTVTSILRHWPVALTGRARPSQ